MNDQLLTNEQWTELSRAVYKYDQHSDRTILNQILVPILKSVIESLDEHDDTTIDSDTMDKQLVIALIESELAHIIDTNNCPSWCCRRHQQRIQPYAQNNHRFSNYLINLARAKAVDKNNTGFISKELIQRCFGTQLSERKMAELLQFVEINNDGHINYKEFATLMLITK